MRERQYKYLKYKNINISTQFFSKLSQSYIELLDDEYYDITIEVGEDPNVKFSCAYEYFVLPFSIFMTNLGLQEEEY